MKKVILVFEGLPACGKTTVADILRDNHGFLKVNESQGKFNNLDAVKDQQAVFEDTIEKYRLARESLLPVIIDRGYPSMLAWDYCAEKMNMAHDFEEKIRWVKESLEKNDLFEPDLYVYLLSDAKISLGRRPRKKIVADLWSGEDGIKYCHFFYDSFFKKMSSSNRNVLCINASLPADEIAKMIFNNLD